MGLDDITVGTVAIGGLRVRRLGYGAMRVSGARNAAGARDRGEAIKIYRRAYERGVNFIDTANIYGYGESEEILAEALHPYPDDLVALAWALAHSPAMLPIPGTSKLPHLDENIDAAFIELSRNEIARLERAAAPACLRPLLLIAERRCWRGRGRRRRRRPPPTARNSS
jgi:aryl-alcohol dehydrogenase-like predicted oxidoreductase